MTREEAKTVMCNLTHLFEDEEVIDALKVAIDALSEPSEKDEILGREYIAQDIKNDKGFIIGHHCRESIVRCRECYHYDKGENESESWQYCRFLRHNVSDDDYCSFGERRES